ncbi:MAG: hypothetical protein HZB16_00040 [Armatimonadetes bacterium]|nr:hypothetical protein [Armatimonadota bacterium]
MAHRPWWYLFLLASAPLWAAEPPLVATIDTGRVLADPFLGFGVQWEYEGDHPENNVANPTWEANWPRMLERLDFMRPAILRVMHHAGMYSRLDGGHVVAEYDSPRMTAMYRLLDYTKARGIPLVFGEWYLPKAYIEPLGGLASPRWADELVVPFLRHLRQVKGYENIRWFNLMNEPVGLESAPGVPLDYDTWKAAITHLHEALRRAGLDQAVRIVGTDGPGDFNHWIERVAGDADLRDRLGAYEYHIYAHLGTDKWLPGLLTGRLGPDELAVRRQIVNRLDPRGASKPFFMGEAGIDDGNKGDNQTNRGSFAYGVWMADYAVQSINAGQAGLIAWDMDDAMHTWGSYGASGLKGWGFWNSLAGFNGYPADDFDIRPWFYTWSLLCRLFPAGAHPLPVSDLADEACRVAAARLADGQGLSLVVVNEATTPRDVLLRLPDPRPLTLVEYRYFDGERPVDAKGLPMPSALRRDCRLDAGVTVALPAQGVVFLTTAQPH